MIKGIAIFIAGLIVGFFFGYMRRIEYMDKQAEVLRSQYLFMIREAMREKHGRQLAEMVAYGR